MNTIRMIAIALPVMMLMACGGGGGGGTAAAPTTPTTPQALPDALITDPAAARNLITDSTAPTATVAQAQQTFQSRITDANSLIASSGWLVSPRIPGGATVSTGGGIMIDDFTFEKVTLAEIQMGVEDRFDLTRFNSQYTPIMDHGGVTLAEYQAAGRNGSDVFEYQSYGGWLANNAFSVDMLMINGGTDDESSLLVGISYGEESGSRPTLSATLTNWEGVAVGRKTEDGDLLQGDATISWGPSDPNVVSVVLNLFNLDDSNDFITSMSWAGRNAIPLATDGTFESANEDIKGSFFRSAHEEVGGVFNRDNIIGAFGARR